MLKNKKIQILIVALVLAVLVYFTFKKAKDEGVEKGEEDAKNIKNTAAINAQKVENSGYSYEATIREDMTAAEKEVARQKQAQEDAERERLARLQSEYYTLTKKSASGLNAEQIELNIEDYKKTQELLKVYIAESGDDKANIDNAEYDTYAEVENKLMAYRYKKQQEFLIAVDYYKDTTYMDPDPSWTTAAEVNSALASWRAEQNRIKAEQDRLAAIEKAEQERLAAIEKAKKKWRDRQVELERFAADFTNAIDSRGVTQSKNAMKDTYFPQLEAMCPRDYMFVTWTMYINYNNRGISMWGGGCLGNIQGNPVIYYRENADSVSRWWNKQEKLKREYSIGGFENFNEFGQVVGYNNTNYGTTE